MKLKSKNSFLKRISCIALSLMLCLTSFTLAGFAPTLEAEAAVNTYAEALNLTANSVDNLNPETFTVKAHFENDVATNGYSNVVYSSKGTDTSKYPGEPSQAFYTDNKIGQANYTVNVYDGENEVSAPVVYEASSNYGIYTRKVYYAALVNSSIFKLQQYWKGNITGNNWTRWPLAVNSSATNDNVNYEENTNKTFTLTTKKDSKHYFWNKVVYCGSGDKNKFYESINGLTFKIHGDTGGNKTATSTTVGHNYVINYRPIYDIIKGKETQKVTVGNTVTDYTFKALYKEVYENQDKYTEASQNTYFNAVKALLDLNVNSYFSGISDTDVDSQVKAAAAQIRTVYTDYNNAATGLVHVHSFTGDYVNNNDGSTHKQKCKYFDICGGYSESKAHNFTYEITTSKDDYNNTIQVHQKTCSVCKAEYTELHNLVIDSKTKNATCLCGYSVSSDYKSNGFRITKGNLFDVDAFAASQSNQICVDENRVKKGAVSVDTVNDTITVAGSARDAYTIYGNTKDYYGFDVEVGKYYSLSYTPSTADNQAFAFFYNSNDEHKKVTSSYSYNVIVNGEKNSSSANNDEYFANKYDAPAKSKVQIIFQAPEECTYIKFRFGTNLSGSICTFSDISFYECDENGKPVNGYEVLASDVPSGENVLSWLNIPSADKCNASYDMLNKSDAVREGDTVTTNLNITLDTDHAYGNFTHKYTDGSVYNKNTTYTHSRSCTDCGYIDAKSCTFGDLVINGNTATLKCSVCHGTYTLDYSAYNAELKVLDGMLAETNKYSNTENCISERNSVNDSATSSESDIRTQDDVDAKINELKEIENKLTLKKYSITFNVATVDGKTLATNITGTGTYNYGTMVELDLPEQYQTNYVVTTWKRYAKGEDKVVGATSTKLYVVVNQESTYTAVINSVATGTVGENQAVLTLNNKSGKTVDVGIVDTNQEQTVTVNIADSKIKIGSVELTAPTYSFYTLKGFYIDKTLYSESGGTVTITKDTVITPYYDASLFVNIDRDSDETFTINNENTASYKAKWNQRVTLKSSKEVMWLDENDVVLAQGTTYSFYANSNVTIKTKAVGSVENVAPTTSIGYFDYDSTLNKVTVVNNFFVPDGKTVTEAGVILSTKNSTVDALKKQTNGIFKGGPESFTSTGNQIRISVSRTANTPFTMYVLAYVVVDGTTYYANEVKTINYTPKSA